MFKENEYVNVNYKMRSYVGKVITIDRNDVKTPYFVQLYDYNGEKGRVINIWAREDMLSNINDSVGRNPVSRIINPNYAAPVRRRMV